MMYTHISKIQRYELSILRNKGHSYRNIAKVLGIHYSTVCRELKRNSMPRIGGYDPQRASLKAWHRRKYSKYEGMKINRDSFLKDYVATSLQDYWTPEEISGRLKLEHGVILGFSSIYKWLYSSYGLIYTKYLPSKRDKRRKRKKRKSNKYRIPNRISIHQRPEIINLRKRIGDFEGDLLGKPKHTRHELVAAVDRKSRFLLARKSASKSLVAETFKIMLSRRARSLTLDNGKENCNHKIIGVPTYFCDPYSSWQKGTVENTFQRLRRHIPKKTNLEAVSQEYIAKVVELMNNTPRKCLGYRTPAEIFKEHLQHY